MPVVGMASRQVFGLAGRLLAPASRTMAGPVLAGGAFVPAYRCGAVPDSHRIPFSARSKIEHREVKPPYHGFSET